MSSSLHNKHRDCKLGTVISLVLFPLLSVYSLGFVLQRLRSRKQITIERIYRLIFLIPVEFVVLERHFFSSSLCRSRIAVKGDDAWTILHSFEFLLPLCLALVPFTVYFFLSSLTPEIVARVAAFVEMLESIAAAAAEVKLTEEAKGKTMTEKRERKEKERHSEEMKAMLDFFVGLEPTSEWQSVTMKGNTKRKGKERNGIEMETES